MTTTTPGQRLHAALLAHRRGIDDDWGDLNRGARDQYEAAARQYDGQRAAEDDGDAWDDVKAPPLWSGTIRLGDDIRNRVDDLFDEVAALRRAGDADLHAMAEVGDRLARIEERIEQGEARRDWLEGDIRRSLARTHDRLAALEARAVDPDAPRKIMDRIEHEARRVAALEARRIDGGDPLRRGA